MFMGFIRFVKLFNCVPLPGSTQLNDVVDVGRVAVSSVQYPLPSSPASPHPSSQCSVIVLCHRPTWD